MARHRSHPIRGLAAALALLSVPLSPILALASIDGVISATFNANDRRTVGLNSNANLPINAQPATTFTYGTGAGEAQVLYQATRTLSGSTDSLNINNSSLTDSYGTAVSLTAVKAIFVQNTSATNTITIGAAGSNPWTGLLNSTGTITLQPGDWLVVCSPSAAGWAASSTSAVIQVSGTSGQAYQVALLGLGT